ncbi:MAG: hypothetical protein ACI4DO_08240 [Roseburia sp.]
MSQAKVDRYKEQKKNRKKIMRREKIASVLRKCVGTLVVLAVIGWAGYSAVSMYQAKQPTSYTEVNITAISDYINNLGVN